MLDLALLVQTITNSVSRSSPKVTIIVYVMILVVIIITTTDDDDDDWFIRLF